MKQLFYSEVLKKYFDKEEDCVAAEKKYEEENAALIKSREERRAKAHEVEELYKKYLEARSEFIKQYGQWHCTLTDKDLPENYSVFDIFDKFWF